MSDHHHHHHHGEGGCHGEDGHDHSNDITPAIQSLLYSQIDFDSINTLNGKQVIALNSNILSASAKRSSEQRQLPRLELGSCRKHGQSGSTINPNSRATLMNNSSCTSRKYFRVKFFSLLKVRLLPLVMATRDDRKAATPPTAPHQLGNSQNTKAKTMIDSLVKSSCIRCSSIQRQPLQLLRL